MLLQEECLPGEVPKGDYRKVRQTMVGGQQDGKALCYEGLAVEGGHPITLGPDCEVHPSIEQVTLLA